jgi:hypothetical protein
MRPQDSFALVKKILELFKGITSAEAELLQRTLERFPLEIGESVISDYAKETTAFDRATLYRFLREEHNRRTPTSSPTARWRGENEAEKRAVEKSLMKVSKERLKALEDDIRKKFPFAAGHLPGDLLKSEIGRALVYAELKTHRVTESSAAG